MFALFGTFLLMCASTKNDLNTTQNVPIRPKQFQENINIKIVVIFKFQKFDS